MNGIVIRPETETIGKSVSPREPFLSSLQFPFFFLPILAELVNYSWIAHVEFIPGTDLGPAIEHYNNWEKYYPCGVLLPGLAPFIQDDWASLYGFASGKTPSPAFLAAPLPDKNMIEAETDIVFFNEDGWGWDIYTKRDDLLQKVRRHIALLPSLRWQEAALRCRAVKVIRAVDEQ